MRSGNTAREHAPQPGKTLALVDGVNTAIRRFGASHCATGGRITGVSGAASWSQLSDRIDGGPWRSQTVRTLSLSRVP